MWEGVGILGRVGRGLEWVLWQDVGIGVQVLDWSRWFGQGVGQGVGCCRVWSSWGRVWVGGWGVAGCGIVGAGCDLAGGVLQGVD